jgi:hypothetical protein
VVSDVPELEPERRIGCYRRGSAGKRVVQHGHLVVDQPVVPGSLAGSDRVIGDDVENRCDVDAAVGKPLTVLITP